MVAPYTHVPTSPWALPTLNAHPRLFFTPTRLARFRALWAAPTPNFTQLKAQIVADTSIIGKMVNYMAVRLTDPTSAANFLTAAYNSAITNTFSVARTNPTVFGDNSAYVFDWGYADLTGPQKTALISQLDSFNGQRQTTGANGVLAGLGQEQGYCGYAIGVLAIEGEAGATSRLDVLRNMVQNIANWLDEGMADGRWPGYAYEVCYWLQACLMGFHIAGGIENLIPSRCLFAANRAKYLTYHCTAAGWNPLAEPSDQKGIGSATNAVPREEGTHDTLKPEMGFQYAMYADVLNDGLAQTMANAVSNQSANFKWTTGVDSQTANPTWMAMVFYNSAITPTAPSTLPNSAIFPLPGKVAFRGGWSNPATSVRGWLSSMPYFSVSHDTHYAGCLEISRGDTQLICNEYTYAGQPSNWQQGTQDGICVGDYSMCKSTLLFSPTGAAKPDRSGSQKHVAPAGSAAAYPIANTLQANSTWLAGTVGNFVYGGGAPGAKTQATATYTNAFYPNAEVTSVNRIVAYVNGADEAHGTFFVQDNFALVPGAVDRIRALWGCRAKPVGLTGETVVAGASLAGVLTYPNQQVIIRWRSSQAIIQMVSPTPTVLRLVGGGNGIAGAPAGAGYESYFDGADLDYTLNGQSGRTAPQEARINGMWRIEHETTPAAANGQMLFAITVGAIGDTAPTYTQAQVLAIMSGSGALPFMPGMTVFAQKKTLDWACGITDVGLPGFWLALFTTLPADDGTGGVEVTGGSYARVALAANFQAASGGGSPAVSTSQVAATFPTATADWGTVVGWGKFDAASSGNLWWADFVSSPTDAWVPFTCTSASPGVMTVPAHGYSNGDQIAVTQKYGGVLPTTGGSWSGLKTVANVTTDTFTLGVNTTGTGDGMCKRVVPQAVLNTQTATIAANTLKHTLG